MEMVYQWPDGVDGDYLLGLVGNYQSSHCKFQRLGGILHGVGGGNGFSGHLLALRSSIMAKIKYPTEVLKPVQKHLGQKLADLLRRKKELTSEDPFEDTSRLNDNAAVDADAAEQFGHLRVNALKKTLDRTIIQVRKAVTRIKIGKYGICENCGKFIDTDRLMVMPETTLCVDCGRKKEK